MSNTPNLRFTRKRLVAISSLRNRDERGGAINECKTPSLGSSKEDLAEFHAEELRHRRARQLSRKPSSRWRPPSKNNDPAYRKSIWPKEKIARRKAAAA